MDSDARHFDAEDCVESALASLALRRPIFHSEADLQHAFAWELQCAIPFAEVRLEVPISGLGSRGALDLVLILGSKRIGIEFKYLKRRLQITHQAELFNLAENGAHDLGRYDFCKDLRRLEHLVASDQISKGYGIAITNDSRYWNSSGREGGIDAAFLISEGRLLEGPLSWAAHAGGTTKGRESALHLAGRYEVRWRDFSQLDATHGTFRALVLQVERGSLWNSSKPSGTSITTRQPINAQGSSLGGQVTANSRDRLREYFAQAATDELTLTFSEVEAYLGELPKSAMVHAAWWHHQASHAHAVWELEGFRASPQLAEKLVIFRRR